MKLTSNPPNIKSTMSPSGQSCSHSPIYLLNQECKIEPQVSLGDLTTFRVGGPAEWYVTPCTPEQMQASFAWAQQKSLPITLLGAGSNLLISDRGIPGLVIGTRQLRGSTFDEETGQLTAKAGEPIARLAWKAAKRGWRGLEWGVGIPGFMGGAVAMNAGAHRSCVADILVKAQVLTPSGAIEELTAKDLDYAYRTSNLQGDNRLVLEATFQLQPGFQRENVMAQTNTNMNQRKTSQPYHLPSCGSVFRNPESHAAAWLIEAVGLKGYQIGEAQVAKRHANFILNLGNAKASDILRLIYHVQEQVEKNWSLTLNPEVKLLGEF